MQLENGDFRFPASKDKKSIPEGCPSLSIHISLFCYIHKYFVTSLRIFHESNGFIEESVFWVYIDMVLLPVTVSSLKFSPPGVAALNDILVRFSNFPIAISYCSSPVFSSLKLNELCSFQHFKFQSFAHFLSRTG